MLVFFDYTLGSDQDWKYHLIHVRAVFITLRKHSQSAGRIDCSCVATEVEYLSHLVSAAGVATDPRKLKAVKE